MNKIFEYISTMSLVDKISAGLSFLVIVGLFFIIYHIIGILNSNAKKIIDYANTNEINRRIALENSYKTMGAQETKGFLNYIDKKFVQSGLKAIFKKLNSDLYVIITLITAFVLAIGISIISKNLLLGLIVFVAVCLVAYLILEIRCAIMYKREEKDLMMFIDLVNSYSVSTDDIIQILDSTSMHMTEPLRSKIQDMCVDARISGDVQDALRTLSMKIGHEKFSEILCNFEIGSKYQANYAEMVDTMRDDFRLYLTHKDENKSQSTAALIIHIILFCFGIFMLNMSNSFLDGTTITQILFNTGFGNIMLGYFIIIILVILIKNFKSIK